MSHVLKPFKLVHANASHPLAIFNKYCFEVFLSFSKFYYEALNQCNITSISMLIELVNIFQQPSLLHFSSFMGILPRSLDIFHCLFLHTNTPKHFWDCLSYKKLYYQLFTLICVKGNPSSSTFCPRLFRCILYSLGPTFDVLSPQCHIHNKIKLCNTMFKKHKGRPVFSYKTWS